MSTVGEVCKILTPDLEVNSWLVDTVWGRFLYVELEDRETREHGAVRLDREAAMGLLSHLHSLCKEAGWLKE